MVQDQTGNWSGEPGPRMVQNGTKPNKGVVRRASGPRMVQNGTKPDRELVRRASGPRMVQNDTKPDRGIVKRASGAIHVCEMLASKAPEAEKLRSHYVFRRVLAFADALALRWL